MQSSVVSVRECPTQFESPKVFDKLRLPEDSQLRKTVDIMNPLGEDYSVMRTTSLKRNADFSCNELQQKK